MAASPVDEPQVDVDFDLLAVPESTAVALAGVTPRRVRYWVSTGLVEPSIQRQVGSRTVRLYGFRDLVALKVVAVLADHHPLQRVRKIVDYARDHLDLAEPLSTLQFAVDGDDVYFADGAGSWSHARVLSQLVHRESLDLEPIRAAVRESVSTPRRRDQVGQFERVGRRARLAGTGVSADAVRAWIDSGASTERILQAYPTLTDIDIEAVRTQSA